MSAFPAALATATADLDPPFGVLDHAAFSANADDLVRRSGGKPIRVASKSVRVRGLLREVLARPGFAGVLAFTLPEALWLAAGDDPVSDDVVVGYPTAARAALRTLAADPLLRSRVTVMVDDVSQLELLAAAGAGPGAPVRVCLELDASLRLGGDRVHLGVRRSPVRTPAQARTLAEEVVRRGFSLVGLMAYEAQVAGLQDDAGGSSPAAAARRRAVRLIQKRSMADLLERRPAVVAAVREVADLEFVNGGGTGSVQLTALDPSVTEIAAGSGLFTPTLFDGYTTFEARPAAYFALPVVRRPAPGIVTVLGGGWIASGPSGPDRSPTPVWPVGLDLVPTEGAGEVQTPLRGAAADSLQVGDRVWFRHAKAGELCEHLDTLHLVSGDRVTGELPTYRGEGRLFI
ncbi:alanine racemase [Spongisporangium articulatum]|uniref:Alanine racemase n=1 Tax=Spongisporangium articulatum TaxID=3362603 RepID=A0ABW8AIW5_9ACTN